MAMTPDKTTKIILVIIALGLWANAIPHLVHSAAAQPDYSDLLVRMNDNLSNIASGNCYNSKICGH
jgi:hypothetical protein